MGAVAWCVRESTMGLNCAVIGGAIEVTRGVATGVVPDRVEAAEETRERGPEAEVVPEEEPDGGGGLRRTCGGEPDPEIGR